MSHLLKLGSPVEKSYAEGRDDIIDRYHRYNRSIGSGAYKNVYWAFDTVSSTDVAWNAIELDALPSSEERRKIKREVHMLKLINHEHILKIRHHWLNVQSNTLCFITDIIQGGSLRQYLRTRQVHLGRVKYWCRQILSALHYLHSRQMIHRDLKCDNIFIDGTTGNVTIGDLGLSMQYTTTAVIEGGGSINNREKGMSIVGTPEFMAPELYEEHYNEKVDIYAFGMSVLEMITNKYPYGECENQIQIIRKVTEKQPPLLLKRVHRYIRTFIEFCIEIDACKRPSAEELLEHPFLLDIESLKDKRPLSYFNIDGRRAHMPPLVEYEHESRLTFPSNKRKKQVQSQSYKPYVSDTAVTPQSNGDIMVMLKIHPEGAESKKVKFTFDPKKEVIEEIMIDMVQTLKLDPLKQPEIRQSIQSKLFELLQNKQSVSNSVKSAPVMDNNTTTHQLDDHLSNNSSMPNFKGVSPIPEHKEIANDAQQNAQQSMQFSNAPIMNLMKSKSVPSSPNNSPIHNKTNSNSNSNSRSLETDSHDKSRSNTPPPTPVSRRVIIAAQTDSLLDQIMSLPEETVRARIEQFGGIVGDEDCMPALVNQLFSLLSRPKKSKCVKQSQIQRHVQQIQQKNVQLVNTNTSSVITEFKYNADVNVQQKEAKDEMEHKKATIVKKVAEDMAWMKSLDEKKNSEIDPALELPKLMVKKKELIVSKVNVVQSKLQTLIGIADKSHKEKEMEIAKDLMKITQLIAKVNKVKQERKSQLAQQKIKNGFKSKKDGHSNIRRNKSSSDLMNDKQYHPQSTLSTRHSFPEMEQSVIEPNVRCKSLNMKHRMISSTIDGEMQLAMPMSPLIENKMCHSYFKDLPRKLQLSNETFCSVTEYVSDMVIRKACKRVQKDKKQLEEDFEQYFGDQIEMLSWKLQKYENNSKKKLQEVNQTRNRLKMKKEQMSKKFDQSVRDQKQILQLNQELAEPNVMGNSIRNSEAPSPSNIILFTEIDLNTDAEYVYFKEEIEKSFNSAMDAFKDAQLLQFQNFLADHLLLKQLRLEKQKRAVINKRNSRISDIFDTHGNGKKTINLQQSDVQPLPMTSLLWQSQPQSSSNSINDISVDMQKQTQHQSHTLHKTHAHSVNVQHSKINRSSSIKTKSTVVHTFTVSHPSSDCET